ncbi:MAG TPA: Rrf2 family transcriptional regulator [Myxococcota bacterium]|nr:Rrf2 family transcriptional regulator [Myxococcota bacterium]
MIELLPRVDFQSSFVLRLCVALALLPPGRRARSSELVGGWWGRGVPSNALAGLVRAGLVDAAPGNGGGYRLARPPSEIRLAEVYRALDRTGGATCPLYGAPCDESKPCVLHARWDEATRGVRELLGELTLADLLRWPAPPGD